METDRDAYENAYRERSKLRAKFAEETVKDQLTEDFVALNQRRGGFVDLPTEFDVAVPAPGLGDVSFEDLDTQPAADTLKGIKPPVHFNIGIVGAGMTGLYTAMILKSLGLKYEILEASKRPGGRVYTHYFDDEKQDGDYYDVGAMRFPKIPIMRRTFDLFKRLDIKDDHSPSPKPGSLIPYYLTGPKTPLLYNNILEISEKNTVQGDAEHEDIFRVSESKGGTVPDQFVRIGDKAIIGELYRAWRERLSDPEEFHKAWRDLLKLDAQCVSTRSALFKMLRSHPLGVRCTDKQLVYVASWCETMGGSTGSFDEGFIGNLIHSLEFDWPATPHLTDDPVPVGLGNVWRCIYGGTDYLTQAMIKKVNRPLYEHKVRKIRYTGDFTPLATTTGSDYRPPPRPPVDGLDSMEVEVVHGGAVTTKKYSHVFNTTTLGCLQTMDTTEAGLNYAHREAIRIMGYAQAVKVGIRFKSRWWAEEKQGIKRGGQGKTDRPTRVVVYPSYALETDPKKPGVLLACYNSALDAARIGSIIDNTNKTPQEVVYSIVIADLAAMHGRTEQELRDLTDSYHAYSWYGDENTLGAWGSLGPGQYSTFFGRIQRPAARGHLFLAGEFSSIYPGWIVGSLNSAYRAVYDMIICELCKIIQKRDHNKLLLPPVCYLLGLLLQLDREWGGNLSEFEPRVDWKGLEGWQAYMGIMGAEVGL